MQLSNESPRQRWLVMVAVWLAIITTLFVHAGIVRDYLSIVGSLGLRGASAPATPLKQAFPAFAADAETWVRHALSLVEGHDLRLRHTDIDNAPFGREVHWNSAWAWTIAGAGALDHWLTGKPLPQSIEQMTLWLNPAVLTVLVIVLSSWAARRAGTVAGVVVAIAMVGHPRIFEGFFPSYVDHHGLLTVAILGMALGTIFMGAGWWKQRAEGYLGIFPASAEEARRAAAASGLSGALGMWVSAASVLPPIAIAGAAGLVALLLRGRDAQRAGLKFEPDVWRTWGRVGGAASFFFYLVEYFPSHLGLRLEANHPFYSLAWWGGAELIALIGEALLCDGGRAIFYSTFNWRRAALPLFGVACAPLTIILGGTKVFVVSDPFLAELHRVYIQEFLPLWLTVRGMGWQGFFNIVGMENLPLVVGLGLLAIQRSRLPILGWFAVIACIAATGMAWVQSRWLLNASGFQVALAMLLLGYFAGQAKTAVRWTVAWLMVGILFGPPTFNRIVGGRSDVVARRVGPKDANSPLFRDIALVIRASQPEGEIVLLTSPNSSTAVGYYGRFKTLGTLYWENSAGLKSAAAILSARSADEAAALIKQYHVTHIAMISEEDFIEPYYRLLHPNAGEDEIKKCFGHQLLVDRVIPPWLQMIPYNAPEDLRVLNVSALLFKVAFEQSPADALYHIALSKIALGAPDDAERDFDTLIARSPASPQPWLRKGELLFARHEWAASADIMINGILRLPAADRSKIFASAGGSFFRERQMTQAAKIYRAALADSFDPAIAAYLAFVLSSAQDDSLRDGKEALVLAERALMTNPNSPTLLNSLAAALAENGKFSEAVSVAEKALISARGLGDESAARVTAVRLEAYRAGRPWREQVALPNATGPTLRK